MVIVVGGMIGLGKTSVSEIIAKEFNSKVFYESVEDWYFCKRNMDLGRISELEMSVYESLLNNMMEELDELPKKSPDIFIYLRGSFDTIINRIKMRGRSYEIDNKLVDYYLFL